MTRLGITVYGILLSIMAALSIVVLLPGNPVLLWTEVATDLVQLAGIVLYLRRLRLRWWLYLFLPALAGQVALLFSMEGDPSDLLLSAVILAPACYLNCRVFMDQRGPTPEQ